MNSEGRIDGNFNLSRAIGDIEHKKNPRVQLHEQAITSMPDIKTHPISNKTDFALIGCDGIWETKTNQQIVDYVYIQMQRKFNLFSRGKFSNFSGADYSGETQKFPK